MKLPLLYVPTLHRELLPAGLPEDLTILSVWPGLPDTCGTGEGWFRPDLPYTPAQASACLADLAALDADSLSLAGTPDFDGARQARQRASSRQEEKDLAQFARTGTSGSTDTNTSDTTEATAQTVPKSDIPTKETRKWAQNFLLIGWLQEERMLEMDTLLARYRRGAERLTAQLGDGTEHAVDNSENELFSDLLASMQMLLPDDPATLLPSWRFMLDLLAVLLPPEQPLFTADARMVADLAASGLCGEPLPASLLAQLSLNSTVSEKYKLTCGRLPLWNLLGKKPRVDKPWLDTPRLLIVCHSPSTLPEGKNIPNGAHT